MTARRRYYAARWMQGVAVSAVTGRDAREVLVFDSPAERDAYVAEGGGYRSQPNYREALRAADVSAYERRHLYEYDAELHMAVPTLEHWMAL